MKLETVSTSQSHRHGRFVTAGAILLSLVLPLSLTACHHDDDDDDDDDPAPPAESTVFVGTVTGATGVVLEGAIVYLVPAHDIDETPITAADVLSGASEPYDEPLEDLIAAAGAGYDQAVTGADGTFEVDAFADGDYFVFVEPAAGDDEHFPGGSLCRESLDADELRGMDAHIELSSSPSDTAVNVGMSTCLACHSEYDTEKQLAHRLGFRTPGGESLLQDLSLFPDADAGLEYFTEADDHTGGTPVYHFNYDSTKGFDKYETSLTDPGGTDFILWTWMDADTGEYKITFDNVANGADPNDELTRVVQLTYGGSVYKQRYMIDWEDRNGLYPVLQYQHEGDDSRFDRSRREFRDYHLDFYVDNAGTTGDTSDDVIKDPDITKNISRNCIGCHASGYEQYVDPDTDEVLADTIEDPNAEYDIDGDGFLNDLNTGCEACHGPGSDHVDDGAGRYIVSPEYLSPSREVMICGRCHDRQVGNGTVKNDHPLNPADEFPYPGISRADFLASYVTRNGPAQSSFWPDFHHSKSHHQQAPDHLKSAHYRNPYDLLTCASCHNMHGGTGHEHGLIADPDEPESDLCMDCHEPWIGSTVAHTTEVIGVPHGSAVASCVDCHMVKTAKTGAGHYGYLLGAPEGTSDDDSITYFENDITSHILDVPGKDTVGVIGTAPAKAMPIPYTSACATCHDPTQIQHQ